MRYVSPITREEMGEFIFAKEFGDISPSAVAALDFWLPKTTLFWAARAGGKLVCVFGAVMPSLISDTTYVWLWTTPAVLEHRFTFIRQSRIVIDGLLVRFKRIHVTCTSTDARAFRWIEWLGGVMTKSDVDFIQFVIEAKT